MNVAFIPVRNGSKSIPLKNIKKMCGKPLVYWTVKAACECDYIDEVYVATDGEEIRETVLSLIAKSKSDEFSKLKVIGRSVESAFDTASTEFAMLEFAEAYEFDNIALIQATSPLLIASDLNSGFQLLQESNTDSILSAVKQKRFNWLIDSEGIAVPQNYNIYDRPRRQEFDGYYVENGAFYITSRKALLTTNNRLSGNVKIVEMDECSYYEIDEPSDWAIIESLLRKREEKHVRVDPPLIKMFLTDCDGCLTDGGMYYSEYGDELKKFNTKDGVAFQMLREKGILTGLVTAEKVKLNKRRTEKMKLNIYEEGVSDKEAQVRKLCDTYQIPLENVAYIGDDIGDLDVMKVVGFSACPADAIPEVQAVSKYIATAKGGDGVIREIVNMLL